MLTWIFRRCLFICILFLSDELYIIHARGKVVEAAVEAFMTYTWPYETFVLLVIREDGYA